MYKYKVWKKGTPSHVICDVLCKNHLGAFYDFDGVFISCKDEEREMTREKLKALSMQFQEHKTL